MSDTSVTETIVHTPCGMRHVCAAENRRYAIAGVEARPAGDGEAYLSATDGRVLAVRKTAGTVAKPIILPLELLPKRKSGETITGSNGTLANSKTQAEPLAGSFPPCHDVTPDVTEKYGRAICIDAELLWNLARGIGHPDTGYRVTLILPDNPVKPIAVVGPEDGPDGFGVLMPCRIGDSYRERYSERREAYSVACRDGGAA